MAQAATIYTQMIRLTDGPLADAKGMRSPFRRIFQANGLRLAPVQRMGIEYQRRMWTSSSRRAATLGLTLREYIIRAKEKFVGYEIFREFEPPTPEFYVPLNAAPHLWGHGAFALKTSELGFQGHPSKQEFLLNAFLARDADRDNATFGAAPNAKDDRLQFAWLECVQPLNGTLIQNGKAIGRVDFNIRIHLIGYACVRVAVYIDHGKDAQLSQLWSSLQASRPWLRHDCCKVKSRHPRLNGDLCKVVDQLRAALEYSVFEPPAVFPKQRSSDEDEWFASYRLVTDDDVTEIAKLHASPDAHVLKDNFGHYPSEGASMNGGVISGSKSIFMVLPIDLRVSHIKRYFKNYSKIFEFVILKRRVLRDFRSIINERMQIVNEFRLSKDQQVLLLDRLQSSVVYDTAFDKTIKSFDDHVRQLKNSYHRKLYSVFSDMTGLTKVRDEVSQNLKAWRDGLIDLEKTRPTITGIIGGLVKAIPKIAKQFLPS